RAEDGTHRTHTTDRTYGTYRQYDVSAGGFGAGFGVGCGLGGSSGTGCPGSRKSHSSRFALVCGTTGRGVGPVATGAGTRSTCGTRAATSVRSRPSTSSVCGCVGEPKCHTLS